MGKGQVPSEEAPETVGQEMEARWYSGRGSRVMPKDSWEEVGEKCNSGKNMTTCSVEYCRTAHLDTSKFHSMVPNQHLIRDRS